MDLSWKLIPLFFYYSAISTGVLFYWRGTWVLLDAYLLPGKPHWSAWASLLIGILGMVICNAYLIWENKNKAIVVNTVQAVNLENHSVESSEINNNERSHNQISYAPKLFINHLCTYYFGFVVVNAWRGLWYLQDLYIVFPSKPLLSPWVSHICGVFALVVLLHFRSVLAPPYCHAKDFKL